MNKQLTKEQLAEINKEIVATLTKYNVHLEVGHVINIVANPELPTPTGTETIATEEVKGTENV